MIRRFICIVAGHEWRVLGVNYRKHDNLVHLHPAAGCYRVCRRCGEIWDDLWSPYFGDDVHWFDAGGELPVAQVRQ